MSKKIEVINPENRTNIFSVAAAPLRGAAPSHGPGPDPGPDPDPGPGSFFPTGVPQSRLGSIILYYLNNLNLLLPSR